MENRFTFMFIGKTAMHVAIRVRATVALVLVGLAMAGVNVSQALPSSQLQQADSTVTGQVTDAETGEPLPGVNILEQGTQRGTASDANGNYSLAVSDLNGVLVFSFVGYNRPELPIDGRTTIDVAMVPQSIQQEEVVVTAFGIERDAEGLAYSTSTVQGAELETSSENNLANALQGKVAGVDVTDPATGPGGSSRVLIRGAGSLAGNNQPLYVVDGMPIDNTTQGSVANSTGGQGNNIDRGDGIGGINPQDIESVNVLKGGPAAALYGSRASNGVILITTKKGSAQQGVGVEFNSSTTFSDVLVTPGWQYEYGQGYSEGRPQTQAEAISSGRLSFGDRMDGEPYMQFDGEMRPYSPQRNNVDRFFRTGTNLKNSVALTGGSESINYRFSFANTTSNAIVPNSSFEKNIVRGNANTTLGERLHITASAQYNVEEGENRPKVGYADRSAFWGTYMVANTVDIRDLAPGYHENGEEISWNSVPVATNPYFVVNKYQTNDQRNRFIGNADITYDILDNLFVKGQISEDYSHLQYEGIEPIGNNFRPRGNYESQEGTLRESNMRLTLNYETSVLDDFGVTGMVGAGRQRRVNDQTSFDGSEFTLSDFYSPTNLASTSTLPIYSESGTNSLFGSADIDYKETLFLTLTGRQDWFSTLNPESNGSFYPSIGGSLVLSKAVALPDLIDYLKLRGSWAQVGGSSVDPYIINQSYSMLEGGHTGRPVQGISSNLVPNPDLRPLTSTSYEAGFDLQFLNYLMNVDFTYYNRKTTNDIVQANIASSSGYTSTLLNVGEVRNRGVELLVSATPFYGEFGWDVSYNMAYNQSEVLQLAEGINTLSIGSGIGGATIQHVVGQPYGAIWGYEKKRNEAGQIVYDRNSGYAVRSDPMQLGQGIAPLSMGITNSFDYKDFSLSVQIDGKFGGDMYSNFYQYAYRFGKVPETLPGREGGLTVSGVDQSGDPFERTWEVSELDTYYDNDKNYTSLFVFDNTYVKLRQVALTYRLPVEKFGFFDMQSASVSVVGGNLAILYKAEDQNYFDPESSYNVGNAQGLNAFSVPGTRTLGVNLRVAF